MKPTPAYGYVMSEDVFATVLSLTKRQQRRLAGYFDQLAAAPNQPGVYAERDTEGHTLQFHLADRWWVGCWADHAVREVRIVQLVEV